MIKFGTDGWRAVISEEFTIENVRVVAQAIADYVRETAEEAKPAGGGPVHAESGPADGSAVVRPVIAIGYDTRFLSDRYARECAQVLAANGIKALLADRVTSTPALSFVVKNRRAAGGIMITASHNPYEYNGIKYKAAYGGSALPEIIARIEPLVGKREPRRLALEEGLAQGTIEYFNGEAEYVNQLRSLVNLKKIAQAGLKIVIDPMHGAGAGIIKRLLAAEGLEVTEIRSAHNPLFGGVNPEPIKPNLKLLAETVTASGFQAGFATDGDADRVGAVDENGQFVNSHVIYALLLRYLITERKWTGGAVKTFSTSQMIDRLAAKYRIPVFETPIGFKYICELFLKEDILLGGEESGGIGFKNHIPERDGMLCSLLLMEIMAAYGKPLSQIIDEMMREIGYHFYDRVDLHLEPVVKDQVMKDLRSKPPQSFAGVRVKEILTLDGIKFILEDGGWILFRASGTEPVVRVYVEAGSKERVQTVLAEGIGLLG